MTVRGGGVPLSPMAAMPALRMGPPLRSFAADAHACIMVRVTATHRIQGCGATFLVPRQRAPLGRVIPTTTSLPPCSGLSRRGLENDGVRGQGRATAGLDSPCARRPPTRVGRDEETGFQIEQRNW